MADDVPLPYVAFYQTSADSGVAPELKSTPALRIETSAASDFSGGGGTGPIKRKTIKEDVIATIETGPLFGRDIAAANVAVTKFLCDMARSHGVFSGEDVFPAVEAVYKKPVAWEVFLRGVQSRGVFVVPFAYKVVTVPQKRRCWGLCGSRRAVTEDRVKFKVGADVESRTPLTKQLADLARDLNDASIAGMLINIRTTMVQAEQTTHTLTMSDHPRFKAWRQLDATLRSEGVVLQRVQDGRRVYSIAA